MAQWQVQLLAAICTNLAFAPSSVASAFAAAFLGPPKPIALGVLHPTSFAFVDKLDLGPVAESTISRLPAGTLSILAFAVDIRIAFGLS